MITTSFFFAFFKWEHIFYTRKSLFNLTQRNLIRMQPNIRSTRELGGNCLGVKWNQKGKAWDLIFIAVVRIPLKQNITEVSAFNGNFFINYLIFLL